MGTYDTTFIVNPQTDDATIDKGVQSVSDLITSNGGKIIHQDRIGTRRLAYPIKGLTQGYYTTVVFEGPNRILPVSLPWTSSPPASNDYSNTGAPQVVPFPPSQSHTFDTCAAQGHQVPGLFTQV